MLILISVLGFLLYNFVYFLNLVFVVQFIVVVGRACVLLCFAYISKSLSTSIFFQFKQVGEIFKIIAFQFSIDLIWFQIP